MTGGQAVTGTGVTWDAARPVCHDFSRSHQAHKAPSLRLRATSRPLVRRYAVTAGQAGSLRPRPATSPETDCVGPGRQSVRVGPIGGRPAEEHRDFHPHAENLKAYLLKECI